MHQPGGLALEQRGEGEVTVARRAIRTQFRCDIITYFCGPVAPRSRGRSRRRCGLGMGAESPAASAGQWLRAPGAGAEGDANLCFCEPVAPALPG